MEVPYRPLDCADRRRRPIGSLIAVWHDIWTFGDPANLSRLLLQIPGLLIDVWLLTVAWDGVSAVVQLELPSDRNWSAARCGNSVTNAPDVVEVPRALA